MTGNNNAPYRRRIETNFTGILSDRAGRMSRSADNFFPVIRATLQEPIAADDHQNADLIAWPIISIKRADSLWF
jgi:hypothetical protein